MASNHDNKDSLKESVLMNLRSVTQSLKGGVPLNRLERDYKDLLGNSIPFRELGYTSLQAFLKDIPDVISLRNKDGQLVAEGVADSSTAHIVSLVNRQKTTKPVLKSSRKSQVLYRKGYSSRYNARPSNAPNSKYSPREYAKPTTYPDKRHSKPPRSIPRSKSPKLEPKTHEISSRNYEVAPRFLRQQNQKKSQQISEQNPVAFEQPSSNLEVTSESYSNNHHISSPRPLLNTRSSNMKSARLKELESATTSREYVEIYAKMNNLDVKYTHVLCGQKKDTKGYYSTLYLGEKKYSGYYTAPHPSKTKEEAEEYAAKAAVESIQENKEHLASCHETPIRSAEDVQKLISRIEEIVLEKPSGMFTNGIVLEYEHKYNELLPENWLNLLQQSNSVEIEHLDVPYGKIPEGVNYIVRPSRFSSGSTTPSSVSELEKTENTLEDSAARMIVRKDQIPTIPELLIPFGNEWSVYIVDVSKTIAARLIDYDNEFLNMSEEMKLYYKTESLPAEEIVEGLLYATCDSDSDVFHRVLVQKNKDNNWAECYFVDEGIFADVLKSNLQELNADFWKLPYQAIHMTLEGLEEYEPFIPSDDLKSLLGNVFVALVKRWSTPVSDFFPDDQAVHKMIYSVVLYNTNGPEDVNMNEEIKKSVLESLTAKLPKLSVSSRAYLTHVKDTGNIFLRFSPPSESWLEELLEKFSLLFEDACSQTTSVDKTKVYASKYKDGKWYRTRPIQNAISKHPLMCEMLFIDHGFTCFVSIKQVCELEPFSEFLSLLGAQAVECALFNPFPSPDSKWTPAAINELLKLAPVDQELIVRVLQEGDEINLPKVNLHKRTYQNGDSFIISINESLAFKPELFDTSSNGLHFQSESSSLKLSFQNTIRPPMPRTTLSNFSRTNSDDGIQPVPIKPPSPSNECLNWVTTPDNIKSPDALEDHDLPPLKLPEVPNVGEMFDIFVTMAANPRCFYVQPNRTVNDMNALFAQMNQFYSQEDNLIEMHLSLLKVNNFYAVKHSDNFWYRARLQSIISTDPVMVLVSYVDYGDIVTVSMHQLQRLWTEFRLLPCQGIKASLAGVRPLNKDWNAMECVKFQEMVKDKKFVSVIRKKQEKENLGFTVLELELTVIDVSVSNVDVYIHERLIENGMACSTLN